MGKYHQEVEGKNGWCRWVPVKMRGYKLACCDCGLVHDTQFKAVRVIKKHRDGSWEYENLSHGKFRVMLRAKRNPRATGQVRRHGKKKN